MALFGCSHSRTSWPQTPVNRLRRPTGEPCAVTCLDCGKVFAYDWNAMRRGAEIKPEVIGKQQEAEA